MKRKLLFLAATLMLSTGLSAQFQIGLKGGYALGAAQSRLGYSYNNDQITAIYGTYGEGIPFGVEFRYLFGENFGLQLDASYLLGNEITNSENLYEGSEESIVTKTTQFRIATTVVFKTEIGIYSKLGALIPVSGSNVATYRQENGAGAVIPTEIEITSKGKLALGFVGAIGYELTLGKFGIFGELEYISLAIKRASSEYTRYEIGGIDQLSNYTDEQINSTYEDVTEAGSTIKSGISYAYSSIGLNIGLRFNIGGN
ncbi:MAG: hypothetical protein GQ574_11380 [Crocinitomix sp.]|nr:hypothetical protein [Crocinitomix sp.]